jgi:CRISPR-associated endonuclease/helicase Cas3
MTELSITGTALRQHDSHYLFGHPPFHHQLELKRLVGSTDPFVAVDDAPTGGGKTSAWLEPALAERLDTIAVYPTNALIEDQRMGIEEDIDTVDHDVAVIHATSAKLHQKRNEFDASSNGEALNKWARAERRANDQVLLLTNPDILVMMCRGLYRSRIGAHKTFELAVVDEFHRADRKERNTLRYLLDELVDRDEAVAELNRVVFLSATPDEEQERAFQQGMSAPYYRVTESEGDERRPFSGTIDDGWHPVMPPVDLDVREAPTFGTADRLLDTDASDTVEFCRGGRTVVMVDGIHEVARLWEWLDDELDSAVERIDGFHRDRMREKLQSFDVLVSNSAVEVGIDFEVDRILFAGHSRASFLQRLGRLRNDGERRQGRVYVPAPVHGEMASHDGTELTRPELRALLERVYPASHEPESFDWRYSAPEALKHLESRIEQASSDHHENILADGRERIKRHFLQSSGVDFSHPDVRRTKEALDWRLLHDLQWYRGDSIQALVYDRTADRLQPYDLFYLLRYGDVEFYTKREFKSVVGNFSDEVERYSSYVDGFCTYDGRIPTTEEGYGRDVYFTGGTLVNWLDESTERSRKPRVLPGLKIQATPQESMGREQRIRSLDKLNKYLNDRAEQAPGADGGLLCYAAYGTSKQIKQWYDLGPFFFLYPVVAGTDDPHCLAIGTDALYLDCHVRDRDGAFEDEDETDELLGGI